MAVLGLHCCVGFSLVWLLLLWSVDAWAHGFQELWHVDSDCSSWALKHRLVVVVHRLSCSPACGASRIRNRTPCLLHWQADSLPLSHWEASRELFMFPPARGMPKGAEQRMQESPPHLVTGSFIQAINELSLDDYCVSGVTLGSGK